MAKSGDGSLARINQLYTSLKPAERRVAEYIMQNPQEVIHLSITDLSEKCGASETTVIRFCRQLSCRGFQELKINLAQDIVPPLRSIHEDLEENDDFQSIVQKVFRANASAIEDTLKNLNRDEFQKAAIALSNAERILFFGVGGSGVVAKDAEHKFVKTGIPCVAYSDLFMQASVAALLGENDVVVGISHSGSTRAICEALQIAKDAGAVTIAITQFAKSPITKAADVVLFTYSKESAYRDEAMGSRIAQLCLVDGLYLAIARQRQDIMLNNIKRTREALADKRY